MYISANIATKIKEIAKLKNIPIGKMLTECQLGINTVSQLQGDKDILSKNLAKIADYLDCSVDYLLGRTDNPNSHKFTLELLNNRPSNAQIVADDDSNLSALHTIDEEIEYGFKIEDKK